MILFCLFLLFVLLLFLFLPNNCDQQFYMKASSLTDISLVHSFVQLQSFSLPVEQHIIVAPKEWSGGLEICVCFSVLRSEGRIGEQRQFFVCSFQWYYFSFVLLESMFLNESNNVSLGMNKLTLYVTSDYFV